MFDVGRSKFYKKIKHLLKLSKTKVETIMKKRNAVHKYLKNDIAGLLKNGLDANAYGREYPNECKKAAQSLMHTAARFADILELHELRTVFTKRYGNSPKPFLNKKFVEKLRSDLPSKEKKLQLLQDIEQEYSLAFDHVSL